MVRTMKRSKFTEAQTAFILRQGEEGTAVGEVCRKAGISEATYYNCVSSMRENETWEKDTVLIQLRKFQDHERWRPLTNSNHWSPLGTGDLGNYVNGR
jgi:hypothetical protein